MCSFLKFISKSMLIACKYHRRRRHRDFPHRRSRPSRLLLSNTGSEATLTCEKNDLCLKKGVAGNPIKRKCHAGNYVSQCESSVPGRPGTEFSRRWGGGRICDSDVSTPLVFLFLIFHAIFRPPRSHGLFN